LKQGRVKFRIGLSTRIVPVAIKGMLIQLEHARSVRSG
jgi:hypothetical protein